MEKLMLAAILGISASATALSQTLITSDGGYIEVPPGKRAVFIKKEMPVEHCVVICTAPVMEPVVAADVYDSVVYCDEDVLVVSPSVCVQRPD